jgi:hypothetical protein
MSDNIESAFVCVCQFGIAATLVYFRPENPVGTIISFGTGCTLYYVIVACWKAWQARRSRSEQSF